MSNLLAVCMEAQNELDVQEAKKKAHVFNAWSGELPLPDSEVYILAGNNTGRGVPAHVYRELLKRVNDGAKLLITDDSGMLQPFASIFGCRYEYSYQVPETQEITMDGRTYKSAAVMTSRMTAESCTVLATLADGSPAFISKAYGKGELFFLKAAIENNMADHMENLGDFYAKFFHNFTFYTLIICFAYFFMTTRSNIEISSILNSMHSHHFAISYYYSSTVAIIIIISSSIYRLTIHINTLLYYHTT